MHINPKKTVKISLLTLFIYLFFIFFIRLIFINLPFSENKEKRDFYTSSLQPILDSSYPQRKESISPLPYNTIMPELSVLAESAICIDFSNGSIIYEKNADQVIPPASMTKLFLMYVVFSEIEAGKVSLNDIIPLVPESYASNMMPHSSLMFLGKNQIVTLDELLMGLSVCSGNDASYAIAYHLYGSMEKFIDRMNEEVEKLGLTHTHFVESSGYSENNLTTAREMAIFCREYLSRYPEAIRYHSIPSFSYPKEKNLAPEDRGKERSQDFSQGLPEHITMEIKQMNTNPLLPLLEGCDGIKTGYIDESGYNLALTAKRDGIRFISVTMLGPGSNVQEGQAGRVHDGKELMEWAFSTFGDYTYPKDFPELELPVLGPSTFHTRLVPAYKPKSLTLPRAIAKNPYHPEEEVKSRLIAPPFLKGEVKAGQAYGCIEYYLGSYVLEKIPLVSDRSLKNAPFIFRLTDKALELILKVKFTEK